MSKSLQQPLSFPVGPARDKSKSTKSERRLQILGRPRRLRPTFCMSTQNWEWVYEYLDTTGGTPEEACAVFANNPCIIKISINKETLAALDRTRKKIEGNATYPDLIRIAVSKFLDNVEKHTTAVKTEPTIEKPSRKKQRCKYLKVLFTPDVLGKIGHQETDVDKAYGLCESLGMTRQQVINMAVSEYLKEIG